MKIVKYQKTNGNKYHVFLENGEKITLYEDIILKENLLIEKEINDVDYILQLNNKYAIYDVALKYLNHHVVSIKEMEEYLRKKDFDEKDIHQNVDKLIEKGYLNDSFYAKCYIADHINFSNDGPYKIIKHLTDNDISYNIYNEYLKIENSFWMNRINKYIEKQKKTNKKSLYYFKNKMLLNLINLGYDKEMINECMNGISLDNQQELLEKEREKITKKLSRKYSGSELERKIKEKMFQLGFFE